MTDHPYAELLSLRLHCAGALCGQSFQKMVGQLAGRKSVACPRCNKPVDLGDHARAIEEFVALAAELDRLPERQP
ncbi:MAG: hypothetical protein ACLQJR_30310 [Stellaceae bacterium]